MKAVIGIGTNIGDRKNNIEKAVEALRLVPDINVIRCASVYETEPWGYTEQANFYNTVIEVETTRTPEMLLGICLGIETGMGRVREFKNGPRIVDLDLLVYEDFESDTEHLQLPHKRIGERDFVLVPLKELYSDMNIMGFDYSKEYENIVGKSTAKII